MRLASLTICLLALAGATCPARLLAAGNPERITYDAPSYAHYGAFRSGTSQPGKAVATLWLPDKPTDGKLPAVVIGHSIGGWKDSSEGRYVQPLLQAGFAVIGLDHFSGRGITRAADVPGAISPMTPVSDALLALKLVANHPRIDANRIGVMGLSMGGVTAELTAYELVRRRVLGDSDLKFAAHLPFYAPCGNVFINNNGPTLTGAPMLKLYAGKDETTPRDKCDRIEALLSASQPGLDRRAIWYPDAYHAWEVPTAPRFYPQHVNARKCPITDFGSSLRLIDANGGERPYDLAEIQACIRDSTGYSMGASPAAAADAMKQMLAFFAHTLGK